MIDSGSQNPEASHSSSIMVEPSCDVRNIDLAATLSVTMILTNDLETVTANDKADASTSKKELSIVQMSLLLQGHFVSDS